MGIVHVPSQFITGFHATLQVAAGFLVVGAAASLLLPNAAASGRRALGEGKHDVGEIPVETVVSGQLGVE